MQTEEHGEPSTAHAPAHGDAHGDGHHAFNLYHGMLGEKEGVEPDILWRTPGTPVPFAALLVNTLLLFLLLYRFAKKPIQNALRVRKDSIQRGMEEAARLKADAEARLKEYEDKLAHIEEEVERVHRELREAGEHERARVLAEAKDRRARMEREAKLLIDQELKAVREVLLQETVRGALLSAEKDLKEKTTHGDQQRLAEEYLASLGQKASQLGGRA
jgi:F-type H+-transporting ATPase subunit b